jgi:hypothetical protein
MQQPKLDKNIFDLSKRPSILKKTQACKSVSDPEITKSGSKSADQAVDDVEYT